MAEHSPEDIAALIANAKSRDERLALIEQSLDIEAELRNSPTWRYLKHRVELEKSDIADALAAVDPGNIGAVARLQARAVAMNSIPAWLAELQYAAAAAEDQINTEDGRLPADQ